MVAVEPAAMLARIYGLGRARSFSAEGRTTVLRIAYRESRARAAPASSIAFFLRSVVLILFYFLSYFSCSTCCLVRFSSGDYSRIKYCIFSLSLWWTCVSIFPPILVRDKLYEDGLCCAGAHFWHVIFVQPLLFLVAWRLRYLSCLLFRLRRLFEPIGFTYSIIDREVWLHLHSDWYLPI